MVNICEAAPGRRQWLECWRTMWRERPEIELLALDRLLLPILFRYSRAVSLRSIPEGKETSIVIVLSVGVFVILYALELALPWALQWACKPFRCFR